MPGVTTTGKIDTTIGSRSGWKLKSVDTTALTTNASAIAALPSSWSVRRSRALVRPEASFKTMDLYKAARSQMAQTVAPSNAQPWVVIIQACAPLSNRRNRHTAWTSRQEPK